jgi:hypothetical protein
MNISDMISGALLMNAMPHLVLGIWKGRMFSAFGFGNRQNIAYGLLCLVLSVSLFTWQYGIRSLPEHETYTGALSILLIYVFTGKFWYKLFNK